MSATFCKYWTSIKIKISMTCVHKENEVKNGAGAMNTAKKKFSLGYNIKIGI